MGGAASRFANSAISMKRAIEDYLQGRNQKPPVLPISAPAPATEPDPEVATGHTQTTGRPSTGAGVLHIEWLVLVLGFCFAALSTAAQCLQTLQTTHKGLPVTYYLFCFALILTLIALVLSRYIPHHFRSRNMLESAGGLCGMVAFFLAVTLPFPFWLKLTTWACFALSLLLVLLSYCFWQMGK